MTAAPVPRETPAAVRAIRVAPSLREKSRLINALPDAERRAVLEQLPPALIAALIQNLEAENRHLLGDLSIEKYRELLSLCAPERQCGWVLMALSFEDARANALPLFIPPADLADALLTRPGFAAHVLSVAEFPIEDCRVPPDMLDDPLQAIMDYFGPELFLRQFPIPDPELARIVQNILDFNSALYVDVIRAALARRDRQQNSPLEWDALTRDPLLLRGADLPPAAEAFRDWLARDEPAPAAEPLSIVQAHSSSLVGRVEGLPELERERVTWEIQALYVRQAVAEGGSFAEADLLRVARTVDATLLLGLQALGAADGDSTLSRLPVRKIAQAGAREVERLRQVAHRLAPFAALYSARESAIVESLRAPRLSLDPAGSPVIRLRPGPGLGPHADIAGARTLVQEVAAWVTLAKGLGSDAAAAAIHEAESVDEVLSRLAAAALRFGRLDLGLTDAGDPARARRTYAGREEAAESELQRAVAAFCGEKGLDPAAVGPLLSRGLAWALSPESGD